MEHYVYVYFDPSRAEPIYVGMGTGARERHHLKRKDMHPFVQRLQLMKREGIGPVISKIVEGLDHELACLVEQEAISKFGRKDLGKGSLLNMTNGGDGLHNPPIETRRKIGEASSKKIMSAEAREKISAALRVRVRKPMSEETKRKIGLKMKDRVLSAEHKAKIGAGVAVSVRPPCSPETRAKISAAKRGL